MSLAHRTLLGLLSGFVLVCPPPAAAQGALSPDLKKLAESAASDRLKTALPEAFTAEALKKGTGWLSDGPDFLFAVESASRPVLWIDEERWLDMQPVAGTPLWYAAARLTTGRTHNFVYSIDGKTFGGRSDMPAWGPHSYPKPGVPAGKVSEKKVFESRSYPGMKCDYWVYSPAAYDSSTPAAVMIWQDGEVLVNRELPSRAQIVFDNLTHEKKIPVIVHILISPGLTGQRRLRSIQYDTVDDTYPRFLLEEILPEIARSYNIRTDGYSRAIAGDSSGGICAFNAAWQRPNEFSRVLSRIGSFTSIQWRPGQLDGGNVYPFKIRKEPKRNIRVWLQDGAGDLENNHGSWPLQNIAMANSLKMMGYDFHFAWGNGTHSRNGGHVELAEEMLWLWRDYDPGRTSQTFEPDPKEKDRPYFRVKALNRE